MSSHEATQTVIGSHNVFTGVGDIHVNYQPSRLEADDLRNLRILLERVKHYWVDGVLANSLYSKVQFSLGNEPDRAAVTHPWEMLLEVPNQPFHKLPFDENITGVFDRVGRELLILGEPGSGKTISVLQLANEFIRRFEQDRSAAVPVVLNLASWSSSKGDSLFAWIITELKTKYFIPQRMSASWLRQNRLLLFLDGLDQVEQNRRRSCVEAINAFAEQFGVPGVAICSRFNEYMALPVRFRLNAAVRLQPLTSAQIEMFFDQSGPALATLRETLRSDNSLRELAKSPLMLSVMSLALMETDNQKTGITARTIEEQRSSIFDIYIQRMFQLKGGPKYREATTRWWLSALAKNMNKRSEAIFTLEALQPTLLHEGVRTWIYLFTSRILIAFFLGIIVLSIQLLISPFISSTELVQMVFYIGWVGVVAAVVDGLTLRLSKRFNTTRDITRFQMFLRISVLIVMLGPLWDLLKYLFLNHGDLTVITTQLKTLEILSDDLVMIRGMAGALIFGLRRTTLDTEVLTTESLKWTLKGTSRGIIIGGLVGVIIGSAMIFPFARNNVRAYAVLESYKNRQKKALEQYGHEAALEKELDHLDHLQALGIDSKKEEDLIKQLLPILREEVTDENMSRLWGDEKYFRKLAPRIIAARKSHPELYSEIEKYVNDDDQIEKQGEIERKNLEEQIKAIKAERKKIREVFAGIYENENVAATINREYALLPADEINSTIHKLWFVWMRGLLFYIILGSSMGFIFTSFVGRVLPAKTKPNQGIRLSIRSAALAGIVIGAPVGLITTLFWEFINSYRGPDPLSTPSPAFKFPFIEMVTVGGYAAILGALWYGGSAAIKHFTLRINLYAQNSIPLNYAQFLTYCTQLNFLQRVGSGYIFVHPLLQQHFSTITPSGKVQKDS